MKKVLLVDFSPTLRAYITKKLHDEGIFVLYAHNFNIALDYLEKSKISLMIIEHNSSKDALFDFFEKKRLNPKIALIKSIVFANHISKTEKALLLSYHVQHALPKPVMADELFEKMGKILNFKFNIDFSPCVLETRVDKNLIIVEIAQGLNITKIDLLYFRLNELIALYKLNSPKVLVIFTDIDLNYSSVPNLEFLIDKIVAVDGIERENLKFLTLNEFAIEFFKESPHYNNVEVVSSFPDAISALMSDTGKEEKLSIMDSLLQSKNLNADKNLSLATRFRADIPNSWSVAIVDDDPVICKTIEAVFKGTADVKTYLSSKEFLSGFSDSKYDIIFLDMLMPEIDGLGVLEQLKKKGAKTPFVVLSSVKEKEIILGALQKGAKRYVLKPIKKETILQKTKEILGEVF